MKKNIIFAMMRLSARHIEWFTALLILLSGGLCSAQPKSFGTVFSSSGVGISYEHVTESESFISADLMIDTHKITSGDDRYPGISASFTWNLIFAEKQVAATGSVLRFFAGPGVVLGALADYRRGHGLVFGMKGRLGMECQFKRPVFLSVSLCPILGGHLGIRYGNTDLRLYKSGLVQLIVPEIGIKYAF